jgi:hypothetical protein
MKRFVLGIVLGLMLATAGTALASPVGPHPTPVPTPTPYCVPAP